MSDSIELIWAKLPSFSKKQHEASNDALISFAGFVPPIIFNLSKPFWEGSAIYNDKKIGVYRVELIEKLVAETFAVSLEGVQINNSIEPFPGTKVINKILNICHQSTNSVISKMGYKQRQLLIFNQIKRDLWSLFNPSETVEASEEYSNGEWTIVKPSQNDKSYDFNLTYGLLHYEDQKPNSEGTLTPVHRVSTLKYDEDLKQLVKYVTELKKYGKNIDSFADFDYSSQWNNGFISNSFEPKPLLNKF